MIRSEKNSTKVKAVAPPTGRPPRTGLGRLDPLVYYYTPVQKFVRAHDPEEWRPLEVKPELEINQWGQVRYRDNTQRYVVPDSPRTPKAYRFRTLEGGFFDISELVYRTFIEDIPLEHGINFKDNNPFNYHYSNLRAVPDAFIHYLFNNPTVNRLSVRALKRFKIGKPVWEINNWIEPPVAWHASTAHVAQLMGIKVEQIAMYLAGVHSKTIHGKKFMVAFEEDPYQRWIRWNLIPTQHPIVDTQGLANFVGVDPIRLRNVFRSRSQEGQDMLVADLRETMETLGALINAFFDTKSEEAYAELRDFPVVAALRKGAYARKSAVGPSTRAQLRDFVQHLEATRQAKGWYFDAEYQREAMADTQQPVKWT